MFLMRHGAPCQVRFVAYCPAFFRFAFLLLNDMHVCWMGGGGGRGLVNVSAGVPLDARGLRSSEDTSGC